MLLKVFQARDSQDEDRQAKNTLFGISLGSKRETLLEIRFLERVFETSSWSGFETGFRIEKRFSWGPGGLLESRAAPL